VVGWGWPVIEASGNKGEEVGRGGLREKGEAAAALPANDLAAAALPPNATGAQASLRQRPQPAAAAAAAAASTSSCRALPQTAAAHELKCAAPPTKSALYPEIEMLDPLAAWRARERVRKIEEKKRRNLRAGGRAGEGEGPRGQNRTEDAATTVDDDTLPFPPPPPAPSAAAAAARSPPTPQPLPLETAPAMKPAGAGTAEAAVLPAPRASLASPHTPLGASNKGFELLRKMVRI